MTGVVDVPKVAKEEAAFVAINKLDPALQDYARAWWAYLQDPGGLQPDPSEYNVTGGKALAARIALAQLG